MNGTNKCFACDSTLGCAVNWLRETGYSLPLPFHSSLDVSLK
jgi:hypothetical protein